MNLGELSDRMKPLVDRLEREPRFSLAFMLAYEYVMARVQYKPVEAWPKAIEMAAESLIAEVIKNRDVARIRRRSRGIAALVDRADRIARGEQVPDTRRRRKAKRKAG